MHYLALDLETTGLDADTSSIIEIGAIHYNGRERISEFNIKLKPDFAKTISLGALKCNRVKFKEMIQTPTDQVAGAIEFVTYITDTLLPAIGKKEIKIIGQNVAFDIVALKLFLKQFNVNGWNELFSYSLVDTSTIGHFLREANIITLDKISLSTLAENLDIEVDKTQVHTALYDAELSAKAYFKMLDLIRRQ